MSNVLFQFVPVPIFPTMDLDWLRSAVSSWFGNPLVAGIFVVLFGLALFWMVIGRLMSMFAGLGSKGDR